ncbi:MAG: leucine-rich repeat protein [Clostridia bacterium]|nr:leucine-rich repeat protein [Clostridia bacterium]
MTASVVKSNSEYTRTYENMRGVAFGGSSLGSKSGRYAYLENMYIDYDSPSPALESIPGFRRLYSFGERINGAFKQNVGADKEYILVHAKDKLYRFEKSMRDSLAALSPIGTLKDTKSCAFTLGTDAYLLDGESIYRVGADGSFSSLGDEEFTPYVPATFKNGAAYEDRNLLTDEFRELYRIGNALYDVYETPGLVYEILSESEMTCVLAGKRDDVEGELDVPSYKTIGGKRYTVVGIKAMAFSGDTTITGLTTNESLEWIGEEAFFGCSAITDVRIASSVTRIESRAFHGANAIKYFKIGTGLSEFGTAVFSASTDMCIYYPKTQLEFESIKNYEVCDGYMKMFGIIFPQITLGIRINSPVESLSYIKVDGVTQTTFANSEIFRKEPTFNSETGILKLVCSRRSYIEEKDLQIGGILKSEPTLVEGRSPDFFSSVMRGVLPAKDAVLGCTRAVTFDGRIFISGNSSLGGTVFYSTPTADGVMSPAYFGSRSYFIDGLGDYRVSSLITSGDSLAVFKSGDDGSGSIFYHTPKDSAGNVREYPLSYVHTGINVIGESFNFFDTSLFICTAGVCSLDKRSASGYREVHSLSDNINQKLLSKDLSEISITEWCGYLVLSSNGEMFLADSRDSYTTNDGKAYEWYYLSEIGTYTGDHRLFRYASSAPEGFSVHKDTDKPVSDYTSVMSRALDNGDTAYYVSEGGTDFSVYPTGEYVGGDFSPASRVLGCDKLLFFFTESGDMCVFNNDMRGMTPSGEKYSDAPDTIHPHYYSFAGHSPRYALQTVKDECGVPYLTKKSVRGSLLIKLKCPTRSSVVCKVGTDVTDYSERAYIPASRLAFDCIDFSNLAFLTDECSVVPISEGERGWISKQITLYGEEYCAPIGVYSINYRYKIKGKIRKH